MNQSITNTRASNPKTRQKRAEGFTFVELLAVLGTVALLLAMAVPLLAGNRANSDRAVCQSNLRQIGRAFSMWADDHGGKFPFGTPVAEGGVSDHSLGNNVWFQFFVIRAELGTPRILVCPSDPEKKPAMDWTTSTNGGFNAPRARNGAISYLLPLSSLQAPRGLLSLDRNVTPTSPNSGGCSGGYQGVPTLDYTSPILDWNERLHNKSGNLLFNDGSVAVGGQNELKAAVRKSLPLTDTTLCVLYPN